MILIITLNPLLERRFTYDHIRLGEVNRSSITKISAGGKGINVSRQLKKYGIKSFNYFFAGGNDGKLFREQLKTEGIEHSFVSIKAETRNAAVIISQKDKAVTSFFSENPNVTTGEVAEFESKMEKMIQNCEIVVFSGSSSSACANDIIPFGIKLANKYDKVSVCDTYGSHLQNCIDASPTIIHNNFAEIKSSMDIELSTENKVCEFLDYLYSKNVKRSFLTNGSNEFYASNFDYIYKITPLKINEVDSTGSGDCFVASIIKGWISSDVFEDSVKYASAAAGLNAKTFEIANVDPLEVEKIKNDINIKSVGKKTKTIDDSPREI